MATMATALLVLLLAAPAVHGVKHTVGGTDGWNTGVNYASWATDQTFTVGDTLEFTFDATHKVDEVSEDSYSNCNTDSLIKSYDASPVTIELTKAGSRYFLCPTSNHCSLGMKLQVTVVDSSSGTPPSPTTTPTTSSPPPPSSTGGGSTSPSITPGTSSKSPPPSTPSGAWTSVCNMNVVGVSVVFAMLLLT